MTRSAHPNSSNLFTGHRVLVTAGASGIGRSIALAFLAEGASVHVVDIDPEACDSLSRSVGGELLCSQSDVSDPAAVDNVFVAQSRQFDGLDILVNCAGIKGPTGAVESVDFAEWRKCLAVNLDATFLCCNRAVPMLEAGAVKSRGLPGEKQSIINISSTAGWHGYANRSAYAAAKWAVIGFTKSIAMELGPRGIRANAICPGSVSGPRMDRVIADEARQQQISEEQVRTNYTRSVSMRCFIDAEDIAAMALFLASPAASRITGQAMSVDGHLENFGSAED